MHRAPLPIDAYLDSIVDAVRRSRAVVVTAAPGAGKTTRVPPALLADGPIVLLQPRRVAARAIAARIAAECGWTLGREVGWQVRFERRFSATTKLLVVTEGVLTARLQTDPLLSDFQTVVLDEFHERSVHADLAIALARQAWRARDDLRIVVMSATLDADAVAAFLDGCPVVVVPGRQFRLDVSYAPAMPLSDAAAGALAATAGQVLCFLPGAAEIGRGVADIQARVGADVEVVPLHGSLDADAQDRALQPSPRRRIVVATNIAETSLTVPGVTAVIDTGLQKIARYDAERGIDSLETERVTADAADQRAGRAGRIAPGIARRLWDARDRLRPHREPDIRRIDLAGAALEVIAWGGDPRTFEWFEAPPREAVDAALALLERLGLVAADGRLTAVGDRVRRMPLHPRLGRMLVAAAGGARAMAQACALLSERHLLPPRTAATTSDLLSAIDRWSDMPPRVRQAAAEIQSTINHSAISHQPSAIDTGEAEFRRAVLSGYPDRVAQRRAVGSRDVVLASGTGATIARESGVHDGEFLVALEVTSVARRQQPDVALIRIASRVEREWLQPTATEIIHRFDAATGRVKAVVVERYDALVLAERPTAADPEAAARILADAWLTRGPSGADEQLRRRLRFAGGDVDLAPMIRAAAYGARSLDEVTLRSALTPAVLRDLDRDAPESLAVPSGRTARLEYNDDGTVSAAVKLQELFGLGDTPRIGRRKEPVVLSLLAPNGRPVQITRDLRSFWNNTYPEVRKELRGRYPKHPWPTDPWTAQPTHRTVRRRQRPP